MVYIVSRHEGSGGGGGDIKIKGIYLD